MQRPDLAAALRRAHRRYVQTYVVAKGGRDVDESARGYLPKLDCKELLYGSYVVLDDVPSLKRVEEEFAYGS